MAQKQRHRHVHQEIIDADAHRRDDCQEVQLQAPDRGGWMLATKEPQILAWHNEPGQKLTLDFHGETHTVQFRHHDGLGYESTPLRFQINPGPDHRVIPTFRFITVEP